MTTRLFGRLSAVLGLQAVPAGGVLSGWSPAAGLVLYWVEAVVGLVLALAMIRLYDAHVNDPRSYLALSPPGSASLRRFVANDSPSFRPRIFEPAMWPSCTAPVS